MGLWMRKFAALGAFCAAAGLGFAPAVALALKVPDWQRDFAISALVRSAFTSLPIALVLGLTIATLIRARVGRLATVALVYGAIFLGCFFAYRDPRGDQAEELVIGIAILTLGALLAAAALQLSWPTVAPAPQSAASSHKS